MQPLTGGRFEQPRQNRRLRPCSGVSGEGAAAQRSFVVLETRSYRHDGVADR
jgi:hypothetical protein